MPIVATPTRRKFRGLARSRIRLGIDALNRLLHYNDTHPDKELFTVDDLTNVTEVVTALTTALAARTT